MLCLLGSVQVQKVEIPKATKAGNFTVRGVILEVLFVVRSSWVMEVMYILYQVNLEEHRP